MFWLQQPCSEQEGALIKHTQARDYRRLAAYVSAIVLSVMILALAAHRWLYPTGWYSSLLGWDFAALMLPSMSLFLVVIILTQPARRALLLSVLVSLAALLLLFQSESELAAVLLRYWVGGVIIATLLLRVVDDAMHISSIEAKKRSLVRLIGWLAVIMPAFLVLMESILPLGANYLVNALNILIGLCFLWIVKHPSMLWSYLILALAALVQLIAVVVIGERSLPLLVVYLLIGFAFLPPRAFGVFVTLLCCAVLVSAKTFASEDASIRGLIFALSQLVVWMVLFLILPFWSGRQADDEVTWRVLLARRPLRVRFVLTWFSGVVAACFMLAPLVVILQREVGIVLNDLLAVFFVLLGVFVLGAIAWMFIESDVREEQQALLTQRANDSAAAKARFLSTLSHEMRTPLNGILGLLQVLETDQALMRVQGTNLSLLRYSGEQLHRTVEDVIDISRAEQGKLVLHVGSTDLAGMVSRIYLFLNQEAKLKGITLHVSTRLPRSATAQIDEARCIQVIESIGSSVLRCCQHGDRVELIFSLGIDGVSVMFTSPCSEEVLADIPFSVEAEQLSTDSIAVKVMHLLGVSLSLHTPRGSQQKAILIEIPMVVDVPMHVPEEPPTFEAIPRPRVEPGKLKILIVDDENSNLMVMKLALEKHYANIEQADGGQSALDLMALQAFDLVISDISMPGMSGEQLLQHMRAIGIETPVIALTGNLSDGDNRRFISEGFERVLHKPVDLAKLRQAVAEILSA